MKNTGLYLTGKNNILARLYVKDLIGIFYRKGKSENITVRDNPRDYFEHYYIHLLMFKNYKL